MYVLAFDLGGSSGKMYLATQQEEKISLKEILKVENHPVEVNGNLYWDFFRIYESVLEGIRIAVRETKDHVDSIGFDSFCNDFALIDTKGTILSPVRCYRDSRTARHQKHMSSVMDAKELYRINGNQRALFNTLPQIDAMKEDGCGWMLDHCDKLLFVSDLLSYCLTGEKRTEYTTASVTQMFDYEKMSWSDCVLDAYHIRKSIFAPLVLPGTVVGNTRPEINRILGTKGIPVTAVCQHDTASAFLAAVGEDDPAIISAGTWSVMGCETEESIIHESGFIWNIANEGGYQGHHRILRNVMGTWILQEVLREEREKGRALTFAGLDEWAETYPNPACALDVDLEEFYTPGQMQEKIEQYWMRHVGRKPENLGELASGVYLGLAFKYRFTIEKLEEYTGKHFRSVNIVGGGAKSSLLCRKIADVCGLPVEAGPFHATAYGNVLIQMIAKGVISSDVQWKKVITELSLVGYTGPLSYEHEDVTMSRMDGVKKTAAFLKPLLIENVYEGRQDKLFGEGNEK